MIWSPQQETALARVSNWLARRDRPFFYLAGYAGTGKTTLARHFAEDAGNVLYGSFTGKAAAVMRSKGCADATTIHRLIYMSRERGTRRLRKLQDELQNASGPRERELRIEIRQEIERLRAPCFHLNPDSPVRGADLVIIDECSMVSDRMGKDLLSFNAPVLVLGDPAQLPPVAGGGFFTEHKPDFMLTEVHRQARESGILELATRVREGKTLEYCRLGDAQVITKGELDPDTVLGYDQVLVGRNGTRRATNARMRALLGRTSNLPEPGDRLVCLRNNHDLGLLNGEIWNTIGSVVLCEDKLELTIDNENDALNVDAWRHPFECRERSRWDRDRDVQEFTYGYCLTVHKAQGSQWPRVIVFDESRCFRQYAQRWFYTGITRASEFLTVIK